MASPSTENSESSFRNFEILPCDNILEELLFQGQAHINSVELNNILSITTPEENPLENPLENSKMTTSSVRENTFEEEDQETTNSNNNRPKVYNQKQLDQIFLGGFFMVFVICLLNPWGIFLFKDVKYQKLKLCIFHFKKIFASFHRSYENAINLWTGKGFQILPSKFVNV